MISSMPQGLVFELGCAGRVPAFVEALDELVLRACDREVGHCIGH